MNWLVHVVGIVFLWFVIGAGNALLSAPDAYGAKRRKDEWRIIVSGPIGAVKNLIRAYRRGSAAVRN